MIENRCPFQPSPTDKRRFGRDDRCQWAGRYRETAWRVARIGDALAPRAVPPCDRRRRPSSRAFGDDPIGRTAEYLMVRRLEFQAGQFGGRRIDPHAVVPRFDDRGQRDCFGLTGRFCRDAGQCRRREVQPAQDVSTSEQGWLIVPAAVGNRAGSLRCQLSGLKATKAEPFPESDRAASLSVV